MFKQVVPAMVVLGVLCGYVSAADMQSVEITCVDKQEFSGHDEVYVECYVDGVLIAFGQGHQTGLYRENPERMENGSQFSFAPDTLAKLKFAQNVRFVVREKDTGNKKFNGDDVLGDVTVIPGTSDTREMDSKVGASAAKYTLRFSTSL